MIRDIRTEDAPRIAEIYNPYILETNITFEETPIDAIEIRRRIESVTSRGFPWIVLDTEAGIAGYAYASYWRPRAAYRFTAESTVYLDRSFTGRGFGRQLYIALFERLRAAGFHSVMGVITLPNDRSVRLHESLGFTKAAHFSEVGYKFEKWLDVGFWQLRL